MQPTRFLTALLITALLAVSLVVSSAILARSFVRIKSGDEIIRVVGSARKPLRSDFILWTGRVTQNAPDMARAYAQLKVQMDKTYAYLRSKGIPASEIFPQAIDVKTLYAKNPNGPELSDVYRKVAGYELTQEIEVRSKQVDKVDALSRQSTELISRGIPFTSDAPMYLYTKLSDLKVTMQAEAARDARARAEQIAASSGCRLGPVRFARMNVPQITPLYAAQDSDGGVDDTTSLEKRITAIVVLGYAIQ